MGTFARTGLNFISAKAKESLAKVKSLDMIYFSILTFTHILTFTYDKQPQKKL